MSKFKLVMLFLIPAFLALVITAFSQAPPLQYESFTDNQKVSGTGAIDVSTSVIDKNIEIEYVKPNPNPNYPVEKVQSPSWDSLSINSEHMSSVGKTSELSKTILITKITPSIGEIILNNTNNTMPVNVSGWHLGILSIDHPVKEVISNGSTIDPMGNMAVTVSQLGNSGVATLYDSIGKTVDRVLYSGNWTRS